MMTRARRARRGTGTLAVVSVPGHFAAAVRPLPVDSFRATLRRFIALRYPVVDSSLEDVSVSANE